MELLKLMGVIFGVFAFIGMLMDEDGRNFIFMVLLIFLLALGFSIN